MACSCTGNPFASSWYLTLTSMNAVRRNGRQDIRFIGRCALQRGSLILSSLTAFDCGTIDKVECHVGLMGIRWRFWGEARALVAPLLTALHVASCNIPWFVRLSTRTHSFRRAFGRPCATAAPHRSRALTHKHWPPARALTRANQTHGTPRPHHPPAPSRLLR